MTTQIVPTVVGGEIPPAHTPFKIQDPYTGRFVWNKHDNLHLRGNGDGQEILWELEYATMTTVACGAAETGYILKNVLTGKVIVDEGSGGGGLSRGLGVREADHSDVLESQIWTMRPQECDGGRTGLGRLYCIQNRRNRAYIVNGLQARGKNQLQTRVTSEESKSQAWRFILVPDPPTVLRSPESTPNDFERPSTSSSAPETPPRISRLKRSRSGDYMTMYGDAGRSSTEQKGERGVLHDQDLYWKRMPPIPEDCGEHLGRKVCAGMRKSHTTRDSNFLQEAEESSWMSEPHWKRWITAASDFDISWITPRIGTCTRTALNEKGSVRPDGNHFLNDIPWYFQPKLEETP